MIVRSVKARLVMAFTATAAIIFIATGFAIYSFQTIELHRQKVDDVKARLTIVETLVSASRTRHGWRLLQDKLTTFNNLNLQYVVTENTSPAVMMQMWPAHTKMSLGPYGSYFVRFDGHELIMVSAVLLPFEQRPTLRVTVASDFLPVRATSQVLGLFILCSSLVAVILSCGLAWIVAGRGLRPLERLTESAQTLNPRDLSLRLPVKDLPAELEGVANAFNSALDRLQSACTSLASFNADVAHELRTPLSNLIGQTQVALSRKRSPDELEDILCSNLEEAERLKLIVNDMLFLARADQGVIANHRTETSLRDLVLEARDFLETLFDQHDVTLHVSGDAVVAVEPALLRRAIANLLENAVRHGNSSSDISVRIRTADDGASICVRNRCAPIDPSHLDRLFDRFYRIDPARAGSVETHGLGLAIVKAVALMHGGAVFVEREPGGIAVGLRMPTHHVAVRSRELA